MKTIIALCTTKRGTVVRKRVSLFSFLNCPCRGGVNSVAIIRHDTVSFGIPLLLLFVFLFVLANVGRPQRNLDTVQHQLTGAVTGQVPEKGQDFFKIQLQQFGLVALQQSGPAASPDRAPWRRPSRYSRRHARPRRPGQYAAPRRR